MVGNELFDFFQKKAYLKFLFRSFHLHGIHSPFVYQLEKNCFVGKKEVVLLNLVDYLKIEQLLIIGSSLGQEIEKLTEKVKNSIVLLENDGTDFSEIDTFLEKNTSQFDMVLFQNVPTEKLFSTFQKTLPLAHNDTVLVFEKTHRSEEMEQVWKKIIQTEKVRVSIDSFYFGFVFLRKEQTKEDFVVKIRK